MYVCEYLPDDSSAVNDADAVSVDVDHRAPGRRLDYGQVASLPELADGLWPDNQVPTTLWQRVAREASFQISGDPTYDDLARWSPIMLSRSAVGGFSATEELLTLLTTEQRYGRPSGRVPPAGAIEVARELSHTHNLPRFSMADGDGGALGAVVFSTNSFIAVLPPGATRVQLTYTPSSDGEIVAYDRAYASLAELGDRGDIELCIWWRCYAGYNSQTTDGVSANGEWFRLIRNAAIEWPSVILGTAAVILRNRQKLATDPTRERRLRRAEQTYPETAEACPVLTSATRATGNVVVAVHGTMACGIPLADSLRSVLGPEIPVLRYEHDTWLPLGTNADELIALLENLGTDGVTLVAHSRGGLVAAECADILPHVRSVTLGTPFFGTPLLAVGDVAIIGLRTLMGALRTVGGPLLVDPGTYLAGFFLRNLPQGLETMRENSDMSSQRRRRPSAVTAAVAGLAPSDGRIDSVAIQCLNRLSSTGLMQHHDLVVPRESALGHVADRTEVTSDHFSYMTLPEVHQKIAAVVGTRHGTLGSELDQFDW
ncbi:lipase family alpha/beta hydrolase [Nocardia gipuzkoensis]